MDFCSVLKKETIGKAPLAETHQKKYKVEKKGLKERNMIGW
jgi:hypothetical protein